MPLDLSDVLGLVELGIAVMECVRLIIGEEGEGQEVGRSIDPEQPGRP